MCNTVDSLGRFLGNLSFTAVDHHGTHLLCHISKPIGHETMTNPLDSVLLLEGTWSECGGLAGNRHIGHAALLLGRLSHAGSLKPYQTRATFAPFSSDSRLSLRHQVITDFWESGITTDDNDREGVGAQIRLLTGSQRINLRAETRERRNDYGVPKN